MLKGNDAKRFRESNQHPTSAKVDVYNVSKSFERLENVATLAL